MRMSSWRKILSKIIQTESLKRNCVTFTRKFVVGSWYIYFTFSNAAAPNAVHYFWSKKCSKFFNFHVLLDILKIIEKINITWKLKYTITKNSFCMKIFGQNMLFVHLKSAQNHFFPFLTGEKCYKTLFPFLDFWKVLQNTFSIFDIWKVLKITFLMMFWLQSIFLGHA